MTFSTFPTLSIVQVAGLATVQDLGRPGFMHMGVPVGGALSPELCARANASARNQAHEATIELVGALTVRADRAVLIATDDGHARQLEAGETFALPPSPHLRYVAIRGGLAVPVVLGGRGTLLVAKLGGHHGRVLRKGDALPVGDAPPHTRTLPDAPNITDPVHVIAGPDAARFAEGVAQLIRSTWRVSARRDRTGVQLVGGHLEREEARAGARQEAPLASAPMVRGAIQVPPSGEPIVLGPDHPTTGGYPVIAVITSADLGPFFARSAGAVLRFTQRP